MKPNDVSMPDLCEAALAPVKQANSNRVLGVFFWGGSSQSAPWPTPFYTQRPGLAGLQQPPHRFGHPPTKYYVRYARTHTNILTFPAESRSCRAASASHLLGHLTHIYINAYIRTYKDTHTHIPAEPRPCSAAAASTSSWASGMGACGGDAGAAGTAAGGTGGGGTEGDRGVKAERAERWKVLLRGRRPCLHAQRTGAHSARSQSRGRVQSVVPSRVVGELTWLWRGTYIGCEHLDSAGLGRVAGAKSQGATVNA
eukprot:scaffold27601_cov20-Tisochrysis_lutea.AAC.3